MRKIAFAPVAMALLAAMLVAGCSKPTVPDVTGQDVGYATGLLKGAGYEVQTFDHEEADVPEGQVMSQDPAADTKLQEGQTVTLQVAVSPRYTITGVFELIDSAIGGSTTNCHGAGGYHDIEAFLSVTVRSGNGTVLATGSLGVGTQPPGKYQDVVCDFPILVEDVPKSDFYSIEVGHRGELTYSFDEMVARNWVVAFTLGQ